MSVTEVRADFPAEPASAGQARRFADATLRAWNCEPLVDIAVLLMSELVSNAILHAGTTIHVVIRLGDEYVRVEVQDGNARDPSPRHYSTMATTGRGLLLVEELAERWGVLSPAPGPGKTVWFELARAASGKAHAGRTSQR